MINVRTSDMQLSCTQDDKMKGSLVGLNHHESRLVTIIIIYVTSIALTYSSNPIESNCLSILFNQSPFLLMSHDCILISTLFLIDSTKMILISSWFSLAISLSHLMSQWSSNMHIIIIIIISSCKDKCIWFLFICIHQLKSSSNGHQSIRSLWHQASSWQHQSLQFDLIRSSSI